MVTKIKHVTDELDYASRLLLKLYNYNHVHKGADCLHIENGNIFTLSVVGLQ